MTGEGSKAVMGRILEALRVKVPGLPLASASGQAAEQAKAWLPVVPASQDQQIDLFATNSAALKTDFRRASDTRAAIAIINLLGREKNWKQIAAHRSDLLNPVIEGLNTSPIFIEDQLSTPLLEQVSVGITGCEALIAQTGSVLISSRSSGGRSLSVLPPHHIVIAHRQQILPDLPSAFIHLQTRYGNDYPSFISFETGPSRTGDIERILVLGAHGPRDLTVILIEA